jgi:hypothetical protein
MLFLVLALLHYAPASAETPPPTVAPKIDPRKFHISPDARVKSPRPKRDGIDTEVKAGAKTIMIQPKVARIDPPAKFALTQTRSGLMLRFQSSDPNLFFNAEKPFTVQLLTAAPLELEPSVITNSNWAPKARELPIQIKGALPNSSNKIQGAASYWVCQKTPKAGTKPCKKARAEIDFEFKP